MRDHADPVSAYIEEILRLWDHTDPVYALCIEVVQTLHAYCPGDADPVITGMGSCRPPYKYACTGDADTAVLGPHNI
jgi:hypothetical protein